MTDSSSDALDSFKNMVKLNDISIYEHLRYTGQACLIAMFYKDGCKPCDRMKPRFVRASERSGWADRHFAIIHQNDAPETIAALGISLYPSFCLFRSGRAVSVRQGSMNLQELERWLVLS